MYVLFPIKLWIIKVFVKINHMCIYLYIFTCECLYLSQANFELFVTIHLSLSERWITIICQLFQNETFERVVSNKFIYKCEKFDLVTELAPFVT